MVQITDQNPQFVRLKFRKVGSLQYISHLDLVRTFMKVVIRAGIPLWFTEGFNPKPKLVFSVPLSIGVESETEFVDIRLNSDITPEEVMARINRNVTDEMRVTDAYFPSSRLSDLSYVSYVIRIRTDGASADMAKKAEEILNGETVVVEKRTKSGPAATDIRPFIRKAAVDFIDGELVIHTTLFSGPSAFLNPEYVIRALKDRLGILHNPDLTKEYSLILRKHAYFEDMTDFR